MKIGNFGNSMILAACALASLPAIAGDMTDDQQQAVMMYEAIYGQPSPQTALWWEAGQGAQYPAYGQSTGSTESSEAMTRSEYWQMRHDEIIAERNAGLARRAEQIDQIRGAAGEMVSGMDAPSFAMGEFSRPASGDLLRKVVPIVVTAGSVVTARTVTSGITDRRDGRSGADAPTLKQVVVRAAAAEIARNSVDAAFDGARVVTGNAVSAGVGGAQRAGAAFKNRGD